MKECPLDMINFLKMSYEHAYNISNRKKMFKRDYSYIISLFSIIYKSYEEFPNNLDINELYNKMFILLDTIFKRINQ